MGVYLGVCVCLSSSVLILYVGWHILLRVTLHESVMQMQHLVRGTGSGMSVQEMDCSHNWARDGVQPGQVVVLTFHKFND